MPLYRKRKLLITIISILFTNISFGQGNVSEESAACQKLRQLNNLNITSAEIRENDQSNDPYCYIRGIISPAIYFHAQLPLQRNWNGRFLQWGDGGKDGDLDFANHRVAEGYAVTNSNTGHDNGVEPGASFAFNNRQAEIDFGYRAVHLTVIAGKLLVNEYYNQAPAYSYFEGCSQGGRQGLMEAQRYPNDFDGIVAGAPAFAYQALNASGVWNLQQMYRNNLSGNLAVDTNGNGSYDSLKLVDTLHSQVLKKCDAIDGITDGVIDNPMVCDFVPAQDLSDLMCPTGRASDECFTEEQIQTITQFYKGPVDDSGRQVYPGKAPGSEPRWVGFYVPHKGNNMGPSKLTGVAGDHMNYLFYEEDPGITIPDLRDYEYEANTSGVFPEFHWKDYDLNDFYSGAGDLMMSITDATDPDLGQFLRDRGGKLIVYHGWVDTLIVAEDTLDYFNEMVDTTFSGDRTEANNAARLFMAPGMGHCAGGPGPNTWDKLAPIVDWVENGLAPDFVTAEHLSNGQVDNQRPLCPYPKQARYVGPADGKDDSANWIEANFQCR
ncbi:MAG: tannase/feruloyl esterase family alpha/beta hydrolase [Gammaproteobacteria bacterium]|nr:tannase/feruloyl esterase family alpha/beta hydrolase [Gammaproteobacteria bacterium]